MSAEPKAGQQGLPGASAKRGKKNVQVYQAEDVEVNRRWGEKARQGFGNTDHLLHVQPDSSVSLLLVICYPETGRRIPEIVGCYQRVHQGTM